MLQLYELKAQSGSLFPQHKNLYEVIFSVHKNMLIESQVKETNSGAGILISVMCIMISSKSSTIKFEKKNQWIEEYRQYKVQTLSA